MLFVKFVRNDLFRNKLSTIAIFAFIALAVLLATTATNIIVQLTQSIIELEKHTKPADVVQMHTGDYNQITIDQFTNENEHILEQETMVLQNIDGSHIFINDEQAITDTIQDISFVVQNRKFDYLLDLQNNKLDVQEGFIAVPIYFMQLYELELGEEIFVKRNGYEKKFIISDYVRDYQMNSPLTSSKRFVIHPNDFHDLMSNEVGDLEYLIQFKLTDKQFIQDVQTAYIDANLPANGPMISGSLFRLLNALSDSIIAIIISFVSSLLIVIALICIRLTFLATIEDDISEIGVMRAIGIPQHAIHRVYLTKYICITIVAGIIGYLTSFMTIQLFNENMKLYLSANTSSNVSYALSFLPFIFIYFIIVFYCKKVLKQTDKISAVKALSGHLTADKQKKLLSLKRNKIFTTNTFMGLRDVFIRFKFYRLLLFIFTICTIIAILPLNIYNTMSSPDFSTYMGIGKADIRIDLQRTDAINEEFIKLKQILENDDDIEKHGAFVTSAYEVKNDENTWDYIYIETGNHDIFPLQYLEGEAPKNEGEIALSYANAKEDALHKNVGDEMIIKLNDKEMTLTVSGIYQDITNGGKTAKATEHLDLNEQAILWNVIYIDVAKGVHVDEKIDTYQEMFPNAQIHDIEQYTKQTFGNITSQMSNIVLVVTFFVLVIATLITTLFTQMMLAKDTSPIAIMRSLGFASKQIQHQYIVSTLSVLMIGIITGLLTAHFIGEYLVSFGMELMGATKIQLVNVFWQTWLLYPIGFILIVGSTIIICYKIYLKDDISQYLRNK